MSLSRGVHIGAESGANLTTLEAVELVGAVSVFAPYDILSRNPQGGEEARIGFEIVMPPSLPTPPPRQEPKDEDFGFSPERILTGPPWV